MGYTTVFKGALKFKGDATVPQLQALKAMFGEDCREHPEWEPGDKWLSYIDLKLTDDFTGIEWDDETEKTSPMDALVNVVLRQMRKTWPDFGLVGELTAQGEEFEDRWRCVIGEDGWAKRVEWPRVGKIVQCPGCSCRFAVEE